ncbi:MAG: hypothetical protein ACRDQY_18015 [Pseudonocardiaceae bacterium]
MRWYDNATKLNHALHGIGDGLKQSHQMSGGRHDKRQ